MKNILIIIAVVITGSVSAQVSFSAGSSTLKGFGAPRWFTGFHVGVEIPRDDAMSFYGKYTHHFARADVDSITDIAYAKDPMTFPYTLNVKGVPSMNYNVFEGGTRYYLGDGFDFGFAAYGGTNFLIGYNKVKTRYADYNTTDYELDDTYSRDGAIFSIGVGLAGGVKYSIPRVGTFYMDLSVSYNIFRQLSTDSVYWFLYRDLLFGINVGYRRDIMW